jgi:hypothetical protein
VTRPFDRHGHAALMPGAHAGLAARPNLAALSHVTVQYISLLVVNARILFHAKGAHLGLADKLAPAARAASSTETLSAASLRRFLYTIGIKFLRQSGPPVSN